MLRKMQERQREVFDLLASMLAVDLAEGRHGLRQMRQNSHHAA